MSSADPGSLIETVREERAKYGTPLTNPQMGELVNAVAWQHRDEGWALAGKEMGAHSLQPHTGTRISRDLLIHVPSARMYDVLRDVEGDAEPSWNYVDQQDMPTVYPVRPDNEEPPPPLPGAETSDAEIRRIFRRAWEMMG